MVLLWFVCYYFTIIMVISLIKIELLIYLICLFVFYFFYLSNLFYLFFLFRDYRKCQTEVQNFKRCFSSSQNANNNEKFKKVYDQNKS